MNELIAEPTYERFNDFTSSATCIETTTDSKDVWSRVAAMLDLTNRVVHEIMCAEDERFTEGKQARVNRLKDTAAAYIHDKYCHSIYENGGWVIHS